MRLISDISIYGNETETSLKLFQTVSVFCFSFSSECATGFSNRSMTARDSCATE